VIRGFVRKELRQLLPAIAVLAALQLWGVIDSFILKPPDTQSWGQDSWLLAPNQEWTALAELIVGFVIAYSVLPGEYAQRTIDFLYSLPIRRRTIFLVKVSVGMGVQMIADLSGTATRLAQHALTADSLARRAFRPWMAGWQIGADLVAPLICVSYGALVAYFRRLGWILAVLIAVGLEMAERFHPSLRIFNVKALMIVEHDGTTPLVSWRAWALHLGMAALSLALAERLWMGRQERFTAFYDRLRDSKKLRRVGGVLGVAAVAITLVALMVGGDAETPRDEPADKTPAARVLSFETEHFHFTYREPEAERALLIIRAADRAYDEIRAWLGAPEIDRIVGDLTEESDEHLGIAGWTKMRLNLSRRGESDALLRHVLYHETTHVLAAALSAGIDNARHAEVRFFAEGLAEYVAYELGADLQSERESARRVAALAHERFRLRFNDLLDPKSFVARHDEFLLYPLGEIFVDALVETCGRQSPARVLRSFASADTPQTLEGFDLWRFALQSQRCDVDRVLGQFERRLRRLQPVASETVPVATASLAGREGDTLIFDVAVDARTAGPWPVSVRVRPDATSPQSALTIVEKKMAAGEPIQIEVPVPQGSRSRVEFQVGARVGLRSGFFTRWQSTALP
jgi:hypothetical protein